MTSHHSNKRAYSETPTRALDFTKPSLSLQDKEPITQPSYSSHKHHPRATPPKNWLFIRGLLSQFVDGGEKEGEFLTAAHRDINTIMHLFSCCLTSAAALKKVGETEHSTLK